MADFEADPTSLTLGSMTPERPNATDPDAPASVDGALRVLGQDLDLPTDVCKALFASYRPIFAAMDAWRRQQDGMLVVGINGSQGSGKTTLARFAERLLPGLHGWRVCVLSIDDVYLTRQDRLDLSRRVHPLLATRGVPGTHDVALGLDVLGRLRRASADEDVVLPSFDKALDDRALRPRWGRFRGRPDVVLFEGWCVGIPPQEELQLTEPVNDLERTDDADGTWRRYVNGQLAGPYRDWFGHIHRMIFMQVPGFEQVRRWRRLQEEKLAARRPGATGLMDEAALQRFLMHYERLTRHALEALPESADLVARLDAAHRITEVLGGPVPEAGELP